jgi:DNA-binding winged helix-turn-helix (wHTH) protein
MDAPDIAAPVRFGEFVLDPVAGELRRNDNRLKLQPQPFKLLILLTRRAGHVVTREEIRRELWAEGTFVDFDQAVNFAIRQIRDALHDDSERPVYIQTVPRRGYRFIAPLEAPVKAQAQHRRIQDDGNTVRLQKALWTNIAELRLAEERRKRNTRYALIALAVALVASVAVYLAR